MSRIGKKSIAIPAGVEIKVNNHTVAVKGAKGELIKQFPTGIQFKIENAEARVLAESETTEAKILWGLSRALLNNMIKGVSVGFEKVLEFSGVGYKAQVKGTDLELNLGYTNPVMIAAPSGISFQVEKTTIKVIGIDKEKVGQVAALIRAARPPEPYKGTGIKYREEVIIRKAGKKAVTGA